MIDYYQRFDEDEEELEATPEQVRAFELQTFKRDMALANEKHESNSRFEELEGQTQWYLGQEEAISPKE